MEKDREENATLTRTILELTEDKKPQSVQQLVNIVKERIPVHEQKIIEHILKLKTQGKISLNEPPASQPHKNSTYLKTKYAYWYWITITLAATTTLTVFAIPENAYPEVYIRYFLGTIFVLWLPGYTFIKALFPAEPPIKTSSETLDSIERIALSIGMSLALVPLVGLLLNYTPWGIRLTPIVLSLLALTIVFSTAAIIREYQAWMKADKSTIRAE